MGFVGGYDAGEKYQIKIGEELCTLCGKVAVNIDDLQCDYDFDWYMPWDKDGDIYDTETAVGDLESTFSYLFNEAKYVMDELEQGNLIMEK